MNRNGFENGHNYSKDDIYQMPTDFMDRIEEEIDMTDGEWEEDEGFEGAVGRTMFDTPQSKDNTITVLLPKDTISLVPSQSLVRIFSRDERIYIGMVVEGPFSEPDGLRADSPIVVTTTVRGTMFMPKYHGRVQVAIITEEIDGRAIPPRFRPLPNSPVFVLDEAETAERLKLYGEVTLGLAIGYEELPVSLPTSKKNVFPKHVGILGTTGGGKSTTVSGLVKNLSEADVAVILFDTEGEYTAIMKPTQDANMLEALKLRKLEAQGVNAEKIQIYHPTGRETTSTEFRNTTEFSLTYCNLSPYTVSEILDFNEAQQQRFLKAYDIAKRVLMRLKIFPKNNDEKTQLLELDEMVTGYPRLTLQMMYDIVRACADKVANEPEDSIRFFTPEFKTKAGRDTVLEVINAENLPSNQWSWRKVQGSLSTLLRLKIFDDKDNGSPDYSRMTQPGNVSIIDLSGTDSPHVNNLIIAELLRGIRLQQEENYSASKVGETKQKVVVIIEEAHEFMSSTRIKQMPTLREQVERIARRGRKRWLGLVFVTQSPEHLPNEILGLINTFVLHKITGTELLSRLKRRIGGVDDSLWDRLPNLAPGQAIVKSESLSRPMLVTIDPTPCKLLMID
ncbi:MAG: ATP-binding protein [Caldilineaceae bacterium]|nr:ATP-binding protein [Caldilineaceae bacterium]